MNSLNTTRSIFLLLLTMFLSFILAGCGDSRQLSEKEKVYIEELETWHQKRIKSLTSKTGWFTLAGLYWLKEGVNTFGSGSDNDIRFPESKAPDKIGSFNLNGEKVHIEIEDGIRVRHEGLPVSNLEMIPDLSGKPTILTLDSLSWFVIRRDDKFGIRLRNRDSQNLKNFTGIERFTVDTTWRIEAKLEVYDPFKEIEIPTVLGIINKQKSPGALVFFVDDKEYRLDPVGNLEKKSLFLIFADQTNGYDTYGAGRFLVVDSTQSDDTYIIDFNKAYNPPCAFTPYATCPLPPQQNVLPFEVTAGEKNYGEH